MYPTSIRANPLRMTQQKPLGSQMPEGKSAMSGSVDYLGHFKNPTFVKAGHNTNGSIKIKKANRGKLHRDLGVAKGKKIPASKIAAAKKSSNPAVRRRATFAQNARKWHHG